MLSVILVSLLISVVINLVLFLIAFSLKSDKLTDASYALSFISLAVYILIKSNGSAYNLIGFLLVIIWALRIGSFLLYRVIKVGKDVRFDDMRNSFIKFGEFWAAQAISVWILMFPAAFALSGSKKWRIAALIGIVIWIIGLLIEATADIQKYRFKNSKSKKHPWIEDGVWSYSRHPNYFGEILVWIGIYLYALPSLDVAQKLIALISPIFITLLLRFVSGIPILEKSADKRWGDDPAYKKYKNRTNLLITLPPKK